MLLKGKLLEIASFTEDKNRNAINIPYLLCIWKDNIYKQCRSRTIELSVWSGFALFATHSTIVKTHTTGSKIDLFTFYEKKRKYMVWIFKVSTVWRNTMYVSIAAGATLILCRYEKIPCIHVHQRDYRFYSNCSETLIQYNAYPKFYKPVSPSVDAF